MYFIQNLLFVLLLTWAVRIEQIVFFCLDGTEWTKTDVMCSLPKNSASCQHVNQKCHSLKSTAQTSMNTEEKVSGSTLTQLEALCQTLTVIKAIESAVR